MARDCDRARTILELIEIIETHLAGIDDAAFASDIHMRDATGLRLIAIGEAARAIADTTKSVHSEVPWAKVVGMRNFIAHNYEGISAATLLDTVRHHLPTLAAACHAILAEHGEAF